MTTITEEMGRFLAKSEEKTISKFMTIAGLGKEYHDAKGIPEIKVVLEKFAERGYIIDRKEIRNDINIPIMTWRMSLLHNGKEIIRQEIRVTINTIRRK